MGYVRGLQNTLGTPESTRVMALALAARRATCAARMGPTLHAPRVWLALCVTAVRVRALFALLWLVSCALRLIDACRGSPAAGRASPA